MPQREVDYYLSLNSPWTYLGHERFMAIAARAGAKVTLHPVDFGVIFPQTGGLPVGKRSPQRQAYRIQELVRWRDHLKVPLNLHPAHWPADDRLATGMVVAAREAALDAATLAGAFMRAVWAEERDIGDEETALAIAREQGFDGEVLREQASHGLTLRDEDTLAAIERGVFGAPSYVIGDQIFWGQDRLDFVERALFRACAAPAAAPC
jgi:2-hydroxychromene-2-carboxylate isomerase